MKKKITLVIPRHALSVALLSALAVIGSASAEVLNSETKTLTPQQISEWKETKGPRLLYIEKSIGYEANDYLVLDYQLPSIQTMGTEKSKANSYGVISANNYNQVIDVDVTIKAPDGMTLVITENAKINKATSTDVRSHNLYIVENKEKMTIDAGHGDINFVYRYDEEKHSLGEVKYDIDELPYQRLYVLNHGYDKDHKSVLNVSGGTIVLKPDDNNHSFDNVSYLSRGVVTGIFTKIATLTQTATTGNNEIILHARSGEATYGVLAFEHGEATLKAAQINRIRVKTASGVLTGGKGVAVEAISDSTLNLVAQSNDIYVEQHETESLTYGTMAYANSTVNITAEKDPLKIGQESTIPLNNRIEAKGGKTVYGLFAISKGSIHLDAQGDNIITASSLDTNTQKETNNHIGINNKGGTVGLVAGGRNQIMATDTGIKSEAKYSEAETTIDGAIDLIAPIAISATATNQKVVKVAIDYQGESRIMGDVLSKEGATVAVASKDTTGKLTFSGFARNDRYDDPNASKLSTLDIDLGHNGVWSMTDSSSITRLAGQGTVHFAKAGASLSTDRIDGTMTYAMTLRKDGSGDMLYAKEGTDKTQTLVLNNPAELFSEMTPGDAVRFATIQNAGGGFHEGTEVAYQDAGVFKEALKVDYRDRASDTITTDYDTGKTEKLTKAVVDNLYGGQGSQNVYLVLADTDKPTDTVLTAQKAKLIRHRLSTDMDTYTKRHGQTQYFDDANQNGGWVRIIGKTSDLDDVSSLYKAGAEIGVTHEVESRADHRHRVGVGFGYMRSHGHYDGVSGSWHINDWTATLYDTAEYNQEDAPRNDYWYRDSYVRLHGMKRHGEGYNSPLGIRRTQNTTSWAANISTELGRSLPLTPTFTLIPQVQLQASWLSASSYSDGDGVKFREPSNWSLIGRAGLDAVKVFDTATDTRAWFKASVLHEFHGDQGLTAHNESDKWREASYREADGSSDTWYVVGAGFSRKIQKNTSLYVDVERTAGAGWKHAWEAHIGLQKTF